MSQDLIAKSGYLFLATRMKRLADRLQGDALKIFATEGFRDISQAHMPVLYALAHRTELNVNEISGLLGISQPAVTRTVSGMAQDDLVRVTPMPEDQRQKRVSLTPKGHALVDSMERTAWESITRAADDLCRGLDTDILEKLGQLETMLAEKPLMERVPTAGRLEVVDYTDDLAAAFYELNEEWISDMFVMEEADEVVLKDPRGYIIDKGGHILFVRNSEGEIVGAGALQPVGDDGDYELTKMGVSSKRRGEKAGEFLLAALIQRARQIGVTKLHLLTNKKCEAAIHLYEKLGFYHSEDVMERFASKYQRANVAMRYPM